MKDQDSDQVGQITRISQLLRKLGAKPDDAVELTELISDMASSNVIAEIRSYTKSQDSKLDSLKESMNTKYNVLIWAIGFAGLVISAAILFSDKF